MPALVFDRAVVLENGVSETSVIQFRTRLAARAYEWLMGLGSTSIGTPESLIVGNSRNKRFQVRNK